MQSNDTRERAMMERLDDYAALAIRVYERLVRDAATATPP